MDDFPDPRDSVEMAAILGALDGRRGLVLAWHLVVAYRLDEDGEGEVTHYWQTGPPGQPSYAAVGLMHEAITQIARDGEAE